MMCITLYTSRVVLECLGVEDFGIYNVVGGIVTMFSLLSNALTSAISRFLTFELGNESETRVNVVFSAALTIQLSIALIIAVLVETVGVWFLNSKMDISPERLDAANWVLQCSIITFVINMLSVPYNALIIAHEKMAAFAYISIIEVILKLSVAFLLFVSSFDSLKVYAVLLTIVALVIRIIYGYFAKSHFPECRFHLRIYKEEVKSILSFTGWTCIGGSASILNNQGVNILLNLFFGTIVNAARGLAMQVNVAISSFASNFMTAVNPQIIKSYASGDLSHMKNLVFQSCRMSLFLMMLFAIPIIIETQYILELWLKSVPPYTVGFVRLVLIQSMIDMTCIPLQIANQATGKVKKYQIVAGGVLLCNFPITYIVLKLGFNPYSAFIVAIIISVIGVLARLMILRQLLHLNIWVFIRNVYIKGAIVAALTIILPFICYYNMPSSFFRFLAVVIVSIIMLIAMIWIVGLSIEERSFVKSRVKPIMTRILPCRN